MEHTASDCTADAIVARTVVMEKTMVVVVATIQTVAKVVAGPHVVTAAAVPFNARVPSHSTLHPSSSPGANYMRNSPYLHAQLIDKMCNTNL